MGAGKGKVSGVGVVSILGGHAGGGVGVWGCGALRGEGTCCQLPSAAASEPHPFPADPRAHAHALQRHTHADAIDPKP